MKILAKRFCPETGKKQIQILTPRSDVECEPNQEMKFFALAKQFNLDLSKRKVVDEVDGEVYQEYAHADTRLCESMQTTGAWQGAVEQMENDFSKLNDKVQKHIIFQCFFESNPKLRQLNRHRNGQFFDPDLQRWFVFFEQGFRLGAVYQGNHRETMWFDAADFKGV